MIMDMKEMLAKEWQTVRELRHLHIQFEADRCIGTWQCYEVCPVGCWTPDYQSGRVQFHDPERCVACGACVLQCQPEAIRLSI